MLWYRPQPRELQAPVHDVGDNCARGAAPHQERGLDRMSDFRRRSERLRAGLGSRADERRATTLVPSTTGRGHSPGDHGPKSLPLGVHARFLSRITYAIPN